MPTHFLDGLRSYSVNSKPYSNLNSLSITGTAHAVQTSCAAKWRAGGSRFPVCTCRQHVSYRSKGLRQTRV